MNVTGKISGINGPVVYVGGNQGFKIGEMVLVGKDKLVGEVIGLVSGKTTIQVYEETTGLRPGDDIEGTGAAISVTLAPGIISNIFDGIERPLQEIAKHSGAYITKGVSVEALDTGKLWDVHITVKPPIRYTAVQ
jgi:V/A-type H+-transporting ATPase subunit A